MKSQYLYNYQRRSSEFASTKNRVGLFLFYGAGKSFITLKWLEDREKLGEHMFPVCILCSKTVMTTWKMEIRKHTDLIVVAVEGTIKQRIEKLQQVAHIYLITYDAFKDRKVKVKSEAGNAYKVKKHSELMDYIFEKPWRTVIADESKALANTRTSRFKAVQQVFNRTQHRTILCGRPILEDIEEVFGQMYFLDQGETFSKNFWEFKNTYFTPGPPWRPYAWELKEGAAERIASKLNEKCIMISKDEIADQLPPKRYISKYLEFDKDLRDQYNTLKKEFWLELPSGEEFNTKYAVVKSMKLHQMCSGFIYKKDNKFELLHTLKLDWLEENLPEILSTGPVLIWTCFRIAVPLIMQVIEKLNLKGRSYTSDLSDGDKYGTIRDFQNREFNILVLSEQMGYAGLNLQRANNVIYFSTDYTADWRLNSEDRCHRLGSEIHEHITYYDLLIKDSIDEVVLESIKEKTDIAETIFQYMRS
jgi:SNF2 family DNA or RNA helicase